MGVSNQACCPNLVGDMPFVSAVTFGASTIGASFVISGAKMMEKALDDEGIDVRHRRAHPNLE